MRVPVTGVIWIATAVIAEKVLVFGDGSGGSMAATVLIFLTAAFVTLVLWFREVIGPISLGKAKRGGAADEALHTLWNLMSEDERATMRERLHNHASDGELPVSYEHPGHSRYDER